MSDNTVAIIVRDGLVQNIVSNYQCDDNFVVVDYDSPSAPIYSPATLSSGCSVSVADYVADFDDAFVSHLQDIVCGLI